MYPHDLVLLGTPISVWNATFLLGVVANYPLLRAAVGWRRAASPRFLVLRWLAAVYGAVIGAQLFAYLFDLNTSALPPDSVGWARYYLDPLYGPKTLYGAILFLPLAVLAVSVPWRDLGFGVALDAWTPPVFGMLAVVRLGCFLQGCCYGIPSAAFGISFPPGGPVYYNQVAALLIPEGAPTTLPVVPIQLVEAAGLLALCVAAIVKLRAGATGVYVPAIVAYSVFRFGLEFLRADPERNFLGPLSTSQWMAILVVGCYGAWRRTARA
jgi:phosphatidylglycerol:prolipoprotein diacylglycerol transferase